MQAGMDFYNIIGYHCSSESVYFEGYMILLATSLLYFIFYTYHNERESKIMAYNYLTIIINDFSENINPAQT